MFFVNNSTQSNKFLSRVTIAFHVLCFYSRIPESIIATLVIDYTKLCMKTGIGRIYWQQQRILKFQTLTFISDCTYNSSRWADICSNEVQRTIRNN